MSAQVAACSPSVRQLSVGLETGRGVRREAIHFLSKQSRENNLQATLIELISQPLAP